MDQLIGIKTNNYGERQNQPDDYHQHEVTPYWMIKALFEKYQLISSDEFVDYGSGQGRMIYYVHHHFRVPVTGIEMNEQLHLQALENKNNYIDKQKETTFIDSIQLKCRLAEDYEVKRTQNRFYFFNPFSVQIFMKVVANILESFKQEKREIDIILYYPSEEYINYLEAETPFKQAQEIQVPGVYNINNRERFVIFRLDA